MVQGKRRPVPPARDELDDLSGEIDITTVQEEYERTRTEQRGGGGDFLYLPDGESILRFLPPRKGDPSGLSDYARGKTPWIRFFQHRIKGSNPQGQDKDGWDRHILCVASVPRDDGTKRVCPICKARDPIWQAGEAGDAAAKENAKELRAKLKVMAEVIDETDDETRAKGVQIFGYGSMIDEQLIGLLTGRGAFNFTSARNGCPVSITRTGKGLKTEYKNIKALVQDAGPIDVEYLRDRQDLTRFMKEPTKEEMAEAFQKLGLSSRGAAPARPTRPPVRNAPAPAPTRRPAPPPPPPAVDEVYDDENFDLEF